MAALAGMAASFGPLLFPGLTAKIGKLGDALTGDGRKRKGKGRSDYDQDSLYGKKRRGGRWDGHPVDIENTGPQNKSNEHWTHNTSADRRLTNSSQVNHHSKRMSFADGQTPFRTHQRGGGSLRVGGQDVYYHGKYGMRKHTRRGKGQALIVEANKIANGPAP